MLRGCQFFRKKHYEGVRFNIIRPTVTMGWVGGMGSNFQEKGVT